ncbi:MAG TPA: tetratricopeptide repeat protein [Candidatus Dormibacteraeota bacterium]|nr:tetratricopeptide repeat protein [Candidatus Dormibacteraeota bacterium]
MAYNKTKLVEAAQKYLNQGKVPQAIGEYQSILKYEPRDQITLMTIGDLYVRQGDTFQALEYFERLAQVFLSDGFVTKAIAIYKKIAKLAPEETKPLEKLAELYVQQGVMSEARPLYLQLAEVHLKAGRQSQGVALLKKLLDVEPDNLRLQVRLADLYHAMGQDKDAVQAYIAAAERVLGRGDHAESEKLADKALKLSSRDQPALAIKARALAAAGRRTEATELLEKMPGLESGGEAAILLMDQYLRAQDWPPAVKLAEKVFDKDPKHPDLIVKVCTAMLDAGQADQILPVIDRIRIPMIDAGDQERIGHLLVGLSSKLPGKLEPLEWLVDTYARTSDSFQMPAALAKLGDAAAAAGDFSRAQQVYEQLLAREPENESVRRRLEAALQGKVAILAEPAPIIVETPQAPVPPEVSARPKQTLSDVPIVDADLDEDTQRFISQSLTDVDLFASYGLTQKAISVLESVLVRAPQHAGTLEKLLDLHLGAGEDRKTAELAGRLEEIYREKGDTKNSDRFSELRRRFQRAAGMDEEVVAAEPVATTSVPPAIPLAVKPAEDHVAPEQSVHEVDLSDEWSALSESIAATESRPQQAPEKVAADSAAPTEKEPEKVREKAPEPAYIAPQGVRAPAPAAEFELPIEAPAPPEESKRLREPQIPVEVSESVAPAPTQPITAAPGPEPVVAAPVPETMAKPTLEPVSDEDYELELQPAAQGIEKQIPVASDPATAKHAKGPAQAMSSEQFLSDLASEFDHLVLTPPEQVIANNAAAARDTAASPPVAKAQPPLAANTEAVNAPLADGFSEPLREVFEEFRAELGEMGDDEDLETHYNLGIAFREMGLLEEAISEFQKVAKENNKGRAFRYAMQVCTLLGLSFMEKGQANIAAVWYERALLTPGLESESILALRYDLGVAQESAGEHAAALKSFSQVYAMNIDYRDVADRIATLEKSR